MFFSVRSAPLRFVIPRTRRMFRWDALMKFEHYIRTCADQESRLMKSEKIARI